MLEPADAIVDRIAPSTDHEWVSRRIAPSFPRVCPVLLALPLMSVCALGCSDDGEEASTNASAATETSTSTTGDGDGDMSETETGSETETSGDGDGDACEPMGTGVTLNRLLARAELPVPLPAMDTAPIVVDMPSSVGIDDQIYLVVDYDLDGATFTTEFMFLTYDLDDSGCALNLPIDLFSVDPLDELVVDASAGDPVVVPLSAPGADGINVWDISAVEPEDADCGPTVKNSISYSPEGGPYDSFWNYTNAMEDEVRSISIYAGEVTEVCL